MAKLNVSWDEYLRLINLLTARLKQENFTSLIGVGRGGLIPSTIISHQLNLPLGCLMASSYGVDNQQGDVLLSSFNFVKINFHNVLIIDDICDSGKTLTAVRDKLKFEFDLPVKIATIFLSEQSTIEPDYYVSKISKDTWVNFPYEVINNEQ